MKKHIKFILIPTLILVLILPMVVFGEQGKRRAGAEEVTETTEQVLEESSAITEQTTDSSGLQTLASSDPVKKKTKESKDKEKKKTKESQTKDSNIEETTTTEDKSLKEALEEGQVLTVPNETNIERRPESSRVKKETKSKTKAKGARAFTGDPIENHIFTLADHKATYGAAIEQANDDYNTAHGFDPLVKVVEVDTYSSTVSTANPYGYGFKEAYSDETVTKIIMKKNISTPGYTGVGTIRKRASSIEIDGQGHTLLLNVGNLGIAPADPTKKAVFHMHDVVCSQGNNGSINNGYYSQEYAAFINADDFTESITSANTTKDWYFRFGNISTVLNTEEAYAIPGAFAAADQSEITFYGFSKIGSGRSKFVCGSIIIEENTVLRTQNITKFGTSGTTKNQVVANFWFKPIDGEGTGKSREFTQKSNSFLYFIRGRGVGGSAIHNIAIGDEFSKITVEDGAWFNSDANGTILLEDSRIGYTPKEKNKLFDAKENSKVCLYSWDSTSAAALTVREGKVSMDFKFDKPEYFLSYLNHGIPSIFSDYSGQFVLDAPKYYDINSMATFISGGKYTQLTTVGSGKYQVLNSDIDVYGYRSYQTPEIKVKDIEHFTLTKKDSSNLDSATSSDAAFLTAYFALPKVNNTHRRITNLGSRPSVRMEYITDAQYAYQAKVVKGSQITGNFDANGMPVFSETSANPGEVIVEFTDTRSNVRSPINVAGGGIASYTDTEFQIAGKNVIGKAQFPGDVWSLPASTTVLDVTPPEPIKVTGDKIDTGDGTLTAKVEPNAKVFISVNGAAPVAAGTADATGDWSYTIPSGGYSEGDKIQIFLEDNADPLPGNFDATGLEKTRTADGNRNPKDADVKYKDATFKKATIYTVTKKIEKVQLHVRQMAVSPEVPIKEIVIPKNGYITLENTNDVKFDVQVKSGVESTTNPADTQEAVFKDFSVKMPNALVDKYLDFSAVIPSNYEYAGYAVTDTNVNHPFASASTGNYQYDFSAGVYEKWITIFIKPNRGSEDTVGFYHWDYELNKFGKIK